MAVRPFYLKASIDGRATTLQGGPRRKDGGMTVQVMQRSLGSIARSVQVSCYPAWIGNAQYLVTEVSQWKDGGYREVSRTVTVY